jgi:8-oxo-dGTP diphosphatase
MADGVVGGDATATAGVDVKRPVVYLVRHAHAGDRSDWPGVDAERPLTAKGRRQAEAIAAALAGAPVARILSSPSQRCVQTVEPLSHAYDLRIELASWLEEGSDPDEALQELESLDLPVVACTHGDIIPAVLDTVRQRGARVDRPLTWPKGSVWLLSGDRRGIRNARMLVRP